MNSLEKLIPSAKSITVRIENAEVTFNRIRVKHLSRFVPIVEKISLAISNDDNDALIRDYLDEVVEMISMCTGLSIDECGDFPVECFEEVLNAIFEVNKDFFARAAMKIVALKKKV